MKFFKYIFILTISFAFLLNCKKNNSNMWDIEAEAISTPKIIDISADYFNPKLSTEAFAKKFPWFINQDISLDSVNQMRTSSKEIEIYKTSLKTNGLEKIQLQIDALFNQVHHYYKGAESPQVYVYSSGLKQIYEPTLFVPQEKKLFIDLSGFNGENSKFYKGIDKYQRIKMNPNNLIVRVGDEVVKAFEIAPSIESNFLCTIINYGKRMIMKDAFLPKISDASKMYYTNAQLEWAKNSEVNIWNFFIEKKVLYSDDIKYQECFINEGPFSKFYTEIDRESSPQIGIWIGWQICKKYFEKYPETKLQEFLVMDEATIFKKSEYNPK